MARVKIRVENTVLSWARNAIGFTPDVAAKKTGIDVENIKKWEKETTEIFLTDIKKFAKTYKRQLSFFFLPTAPTEKPIPDDFRTLDSVKLDDIHQEVRLAIRRAQNNRKIIEDLFSQDYELKIRKQISLEDDATATAYAFRKFFSLTIEQQFAQSDEKEALAYWIEAFEDKGIFIFQMELTESFRGFCLRGNSLPPVIVVNSKDARAGKIFTLIHELSHLFIKQTDIDALTYSRGEAKAHIVIEAFANEFAGAFLVPNRTLQAEQGYAQYKATKSPEHILRLSRRFNVSEAVILRRMYVLGVIDKATFEKENTTLKEKYARIKAQKKAELEKRLAENPGAFVPRNIPKEAIQKIGLFLGAKTFQAVSEGRMTTFELVKFLDVKTRHVDGIKTLMEKKYPSVI